MLGKTTILAGIFGLATIAEAALCPIPSSRKRQAGQMDPAFETPLSELNGRLECVGGLANARNPFLLVPGTGNNGTQSWLTGYIKLLGRNGGLGFDPCYVSPPPFMLNDSQTNAEYVVNAVNVLYEQNCRPIPVMGWSQGNLVTQWGLTFFPSIRRKVRQFISLAGDFRGTVEASILLPLQLGNGAPSVFQQDAASNYIAALMQKGGNYNWVPTTSIFSRTDEVIQPELDATIAGSTSALGGSAIGNILAQDFCPLLAIGHGEQLYVDFSYQVVKLALASPTRFASRDTVRTFVAQNPTVCLNNRVAPGLTQDDVSFLQRSFAFAAGVVLAPPIVVNQEPALRDYVATTPDNPVHDL